MKLTQLRALVAIAEGHTVSEAARHHFFQAASAEFDYGEFSALGSLKPYVLNQLDSAFINLPAP